MNVGNSLTQACRPNCVKREEATEYRWSSLAKKSGRSRGIAPTVDGIRMPSDV